MGQLPSQENPRANRALHRRSYATLAMAQANERAKPQPSGQGYISRGAITRRPSLLLHGFVVVARVIAVFVAAAVFAFVARVVFLLFVSGAHISYMIVT